MTYCVGLMLEKGLVFMSDTRTNAGVDNVSTFCKMKTWEVPGDRVITIMSSGNLATTQAVVSQLSERTKAPGDRAPAILEAPTMFELATMIGKRLRKVVQQSRKGGGKGFGASLILGGQIAGAPPRLFLIYEEGNFIEAGPDTPFFQIGETKYGRPILVRTYDPAMSFEQAVKMLILSFDSTIKANLSVGLPIDLMVYETDSMGVTQQRRFELDDPYFRKVSEGWGAALKKAIDSVPDFEF